jgi:hypothetical protein
MSLQYVGACTKTKGFTLETQPYALPHPYDLGRAREAR